MRVLLLMLLACGCGPGADPTADRLADVEAGMRALNRGVAFTTAFIGTAVIDSGATAELITNALALYFKANTNSCGVATVSGTKLDADLTRGCTLGSAGSLVRGTVHAEVSVDNRVVRIDFKPSLTVDGADLLTGSLRADTSGSTADVLYRSDLRLGAAHVVTMAQRAGIGGGTARLETTGTLEGASVAGARFTAARLSQRFTGCYPDDGSLQLVTAESDETFLFDSTTPSTGQVSVGGKLVSLPPRTGCPRQ